MKTKTPFEEFRDVLAKMDPAYKQKLIKAHQEFGRLRLLCEVKGMIEILPGLRGIRVLKRTKEVRELKKVVDTLKPGGFKWEEGEEKE